MKSKKYKENIYGSYIPAPNYAPGHNYKTTKYVGDYKNTNYYWI